MSIFKNNNFDKEFENDGIIEFGNSSKEFNDDNDYNNYTDHNEHSTSNTSDANEISKKVDVWEEKTQTVATKPVDLTELKKRMFFLIVFIFIILTIINISNKKNTKKYINYTDTTDITGTNYPIDQITSYDYDKTIKFIVPDSITVFSNYSKFLKTFEKDSAYIQISTSYR